MSKTLVEMAAEIIQAQSGSKNMTSEEIAQALQTTFKTLTALQAEECKINSATEAGVQGLGLEEKQAAIAPEKSIQRNKIICLECGQEFKMLSPKHLRSHDLTGREYRQKYGFSLRQPLCAKGLSDRRKKAGKDRGLPENLRKAIENRKKKKTAAPKKSKKAAAAS